MNEDSFLRYVEKTRDCDPARLDAAVNRGIRRAKSGRVDSRKLAMLAAACAFSAVMCFSVNLRLFQSAAKDYYQARNEILPGVSEALGGYVEDIAYNIEVFAELHIFNF